MAANGPSAPAKSDSAAVAAKRVAGARTSVTKRRSGLSTKAKWWLGGGATALAIVGKGAWDIHSQIAADVLGEKYKRAAKGLLQKFSKAKGHAKGAVSRGRRAVKKVASGWNFTDEPRDARGRWTYGGGIVHGGTEVMS